MRAIFISYRRDDTEGHAGRLFEDLCDRFGKGAVFMDVAGIEPGRDFRRVIEQQVASCGVLLAVIGKNWLTITDKHGQRRLDDPYDFVRLETASALKRDIPVIPVLVHDAEMPRADQLPADLQELAFRNSVELNHARWASDVQLLIAALMPHVDTEPVEPPARFPRWAVASLATLVAGGVGYAAWDHFAPSPAPPAADDRVVVAAAGSGSAAASTAAGPAASSAAMPPAPRPASAASATTATGLGTSGPAAQQAAPATAGSPPSAAASSPSAPAVVVAAAPIPAPPASRPAPAPSPSPTASRAPAPGPAAVHSPAPKPPAPRPAPPPVEAAPRPAPSPAPGSGGYGAAPAPAPGSYGSAPSPAPGGYGASPAPRPAPTPSPAPPDAAPSAGPQVLAARSDPALELFGSPGTVAMATRTIAIGPGTSYVNVTGGEVIRFDVGDKSFVWNFNGQRSSFDLAKVAPPGVLARKVTAYVAPNPMQPRRS